MLFKDVMVEEALKQRLLNMVKENRISHALLFLANEGAHSFALAIAFAQYISCSRRSDSDSCGTCSSCVKYEKLTHPDLHLLFPNSTTTKVKKDPDSEQFYADFRKFVLQNRYFITLADWMNVLEGENKQPSINLRDTSNIIAWNSTRSYEGGYKIYILWIAERLYHAAAPRLLKTLEEPENRSLFILISENSDRILPTILSRTQMVKIGKPTTQLIADKLTQNFDIDSQYAMELAMGCDGNINHAIKLLQNTENNSVMLNQFQQYWQSAHALGQQKSNAEINYTATNLVIEEIVKEGREYQKQFMIYLLRMIRFLLLNDDSYKSQQLIRATSSEKSILNAFQGAFNIAAATAIMQECNQALYHIERNGNTQLILTDLYFKIAQNINRHKNA